jgi:enoyl-CoA hydratase
MTSTYERYQYLVVSKNLSSRVATVTLNRPERLNAVNQPFHEELRDVWLDLGNDYEVDVIILTGAGRAFCAGGDVKDMRDMDQAFGVGRSIEPLAVMNAEARRIARNMLDVEQPIIAAVNGDAFGLGASIALLCDIVVIAEDARLADTHVNAGLVAGDGGPVLWPLIVGPLRAKEFLMRGSRIDGLTAASLGLANYAVPKEKTFAKAMEIAEELAQGAPLAIRWTKYSVNKWLKQVLEQVFDVSMALELTTMRSTDHKEAVSALLEKRAPKFTGR